MNRGKSLLIEVFYKVFFEKDCVSGQFSFFLLDQTRILSLEAVRDAALCSDGIIEKRIRREGYEILFPTYPNISIADCLDKCVEYNENAMLTPDEQCNHVSHEHLRRINWDGDGGVAVPTRDGQKKVTDYTVCVLMRSPRSKLEARITTFDKYYHPIGDPWRVGRWDSYLIPECHPTTNRMFI